MILKVIGGGLAGSEAAWQAAQRGMSVEIYEMRPEQSTGAHQTGELAELVCSNSLGSNFINRASGLLKEELRQMGSLLIECADQCSVPAGGALAVDRNLFSACVQSRIEQHPRIKIMREEVTELPEPPAVIATGPLTSQKFSNALKHISGERHLFFYDAIAPIVAIDSINMDIAYRANRYDLGNSDEGDYINCPFDKESYHHFREALISAERIPLKPFEGDLEKGVDAGEGVYFQGCQPVEVIAGQGERALAFGPLRPAGLANPRTGRWPYAVVQLRQDNLAGDLYNMVGFQTNLRYSEQNRIFRMIPGLENATFERYGHMHRNIFMASPKLLNNNLEFIDHPGLYLSGQLAGIEGYAGNIASGLIAGVNAARKTKGLSEIILPTTTMTGALIHYITHADLQDFQPMKAMFGLLPKPEDQIKRSKQDRYDYYAQRALDDLDQYMDRVNFNQKF